MPTNPPFPIAMGQRTLAAIVFTDVVGYSARMQKEEAGTLELLEADFAIMKDYSDGLSGVVLKTTGDGLLIYFSSAVHAVTWAVKTQRHFAERARTELLTKILRHRVGVHVGDVFRTEDDVVGDGVNIAARVQSEAPTGGVCISQTAYDMVKNKMELHVSRLSARQLKNISEPVPMYHVLLDGPELTSVQPEATKIAASKVDPEAQRRKNLVGLGVVIALLGLGYAMFRVYRGHEEQLSESQQAQAALSRALKGEAVTAAVASDNAGEKMTGPDFVRLTTRSPANPATMDRAVFAQANESIGVLEQWLQTRWPLYPRSHRLLVRDLDGGGAEWAVYAEGENIWLTQGGAGRKSPWSEWPVDKQAAIIVALMRDAAPQVDRGVKRGAEAFAFVHGLPEMAAAVTGIEAQR